jgi:N-carbamoyl-L-amino-acid hydrolase
VSRQSAANKDIAQDEKVTVFWDRIWQIEPIRLHDVSSLCPMRRFAETGATRHRLPSGPLHDAAEVARACVPTIMMFVQSLHGINHNKMEDTKEEHLELAEKAMRWIATR